MRWVRTRPGWAGQGGQKGEFLGSEVDSVASDAHAVAREVDLHLADGQYGGNLGAVGRTPVAEGDTNAGEQSGVEKSLVT